MKMRILKLYIAGVLVFASVALHGINLYAAQEQVGFMEDGFKLLARAEQYYKASIYIDLKTQYGLMSPQYRASVPFARFKKTFGEALPPLPGTGSPAEKGLVHISGSLTPKENTASLGSMLSKPIKKNKHSFKNSLPPSSISNKLLYHFEKVKFLNEEKAILYFELTTYQRMPLVFPGIPPYLERTKTDSDFWVKVDKEWYREVEVRAANISGSRFSVSLKEGKSKLSGTVRTLKNIVKYKLGEMAKQRFSASDTEDTLTKLMSIAPFTVDAYVKKRGVDSLKETLQKGLNSRLEYLSFSLKRMPTSPNIMKKVAEIKRLLGRKSDALGVYLKSATFEKNNLKTILNISDLYFEKEDYKKSLEYMDKYLTLNMKVRSSRAKPKIQMWIESRAASKEKTTKLINAIGRQSAEELFLELVHKQEWHTAAELIRKLYDYEGFRIDSKIKAALLKSGSRPKIVPMKISELVPGNMHDILRKISIFELSRMVRFFGYSIYWTGAPIGTTGVEAPVNIMVRSAGYFLYNNRIYGKYDNIIIGRKDASPHRIGYNVVALDETSGKILQKKNFDTAFGKKNADLLADFVAKIKDGRIVVMSTREEASEQLNKKAVNAMYSIGAGKSLLGKFRWAHAIIGVKGAKPGTALEMLSLYPANVTIYKSNSPYTFKELMEDSTGKILKKIKRKTVFISDIQPDSTLLLAFP